MNRLIAIAILAGTISACEQDPRNLTITEENQDSFMEELTDATLTVEEIGLLTAAQMRRAFATGLGAEGPVFIGKTVGDVIEEERTFRAAANARQAEEDRLAAEAKAAADGVVARIVPGPHDAHRQDSHWPMRYDTGRPSSVIRLRISQPRTTSLPCPAGLRARRPSPMMDL